MSNGSRRGGLQEQLTSKEVTDCSIKVSRLEAELAEVRAVQLIICYDASIRTMLCMLIGYPPLRLR